MYTQKPRYATFLFVIVIVMMMAVFSLIVWSWATLFGLSLSWMPIFLMAIGMIGIMMISMIISRFGGAYLEIFWTFLLRIIYITRILFPLLILSDIIGLRYTLPLRVYIGIGVLWLWYGIYHWIHTTITPLILSSPKISKQHTIVFISDIHVDAVRHHRYIQSIVDTIKKLQPDMVIIGWDLVNSSKRHNVNAFLPFNQLTMPVFATLGNHDHMGNQDVLHEIFEKTNITPLRNHSVAIHELQIVGIDDKTYRGEHTLHDILSKSIIPDEEKFTLLVTHQPLHLKKLDQHPIDLELAWHTHNGQFIPLQRIMRIFNDYVYGSYHYEKKTAFVSQGIGSRWAPIRIGTQSEMVVITIHPE